MKRRTSGLLLHITSLPTPYGIGDFGPSAYQFADFLAGAGQSCWQILPLNPTDVEYDSSPYHSISAFAGNHLLISLDLLVEEGLLEKSELEPLPPESRSRVDFDAVVAYKMRILPLAYERFRDRSDRHDFDRFCAEQADWLEDYALYAAMKGRTGRENWTTWPAGLKHRDPGAMEAARHDLAGGIEMEKFLQFTVQRQWLALKRYCNDRGIFIIGDIPIYVDFDSADVWSNQGIFKLDEHQQPYVISGVPPDYFSETGQLWGNPIYNWDALRARGYGWWLDRVRRNLKLFDVVRIDHFRGLVACWEVSAGETTAINGRWVDAPAVDFFNAVARITPYPPIIAEDLGIITPDVREVMHRFEFPGMKVLLFAFGGDVATNPYTPHNVGTNSIIYTGTHDNNTVRGWIDNEADDATIRRLFDYIGHDIPADRLNWAMIRMAMGSVANTAIIPVQDVLGLGGEARMNTPSTPKGNWRWKLNGGELTDEHRKRLRHLSEIFGRS